MARVLQITPMTEGGWDAQDAKNQTSNDDAEGQIGPEI